LEVGKPVLGNEKERSRRLATQIFALSLIAQKIAVISLLFCPWLYPVLFCVLIIVFRPRIVEIGPQTSAPAVQQTWCKVRTLIRRPSMARSRTTQRRVTLVVKPGASLMLAGTVCRRVVSNGDKLQFVALWKESGLPRAAFERQHGLAQASLCKWERLLPRIERCDRAGLCARAGAQPRLEEKLMAWLLERWGWKGFRVSSRMMQVQARVIAAELKIANFECSSGWLAAFRRRQGLVSTSLHGEKATADHEAAEAYPPNFRRMVEELSVQISNIYNADETLLYPRLQTRQTVCPERLATILRGGKQDRFRIGILLTSCADGSNTCPMVFSSTARHPQGIMSAGYRHVLPNVLTNPSNTHYYAQSANGWISRETIVFYLTHVLPTHIRARGDDRRAVLLLDGCGLHFTALLSMHMHNKLRGLVPDGPVVIDGTAIVGTPLGNMTARTPTDEHAMHMLRAHGANLTIGDVTLYVRISPPNTTSILQPCDQGLIASLKRAWRSSLDLRSVSATSAVEACDAKKVSVKEIMSYLDDIVKNIPLPAALTFWAPLMDGSVPSYHGMITEGIREIAEKVVAARDRLYDGEA
jgi:hypothetical protein